MQLNLIGTQHGLRSILNSDDSGFDHEFENFEVPDKVTVHSLGHTAPWNKKFDAVVVNMGRIWFQSTPQDAMILGLELIQQAALAQRGINTVKEVEYVR